MPTLPRILLAVLLLAAVGGCTSVTATGDPSTAATVNDRHVPVDAVKEQYQFATSDPSGPEPDAEQVRAIQAQIVEFLIRLELLEQGGEEMGVTFQGSDLQRARESLAVDFGGMEALEDQLALQGLELSDLDVQLRAQGLQTLINESLSSDVEIDDADVRAAYEQQYGDRPEVRHVLLETAQEAEDVIDEIEGGADFNELATERSMDPSAQDNAGELGQLEPGQTVAPFEEAAFAADAGEVVGPVETDFGFHVIEVTDVVSRDDAPEFEEVDEELRSSLAAQGGGQLFDQWITERAAEADVRVNPRFGEWEPLGTAVSPTSVLDRQSPLDR